MCQRELTEFFAELSEFSLPNQYSTRFLMVLAKRLVAHALRAIVWLEGQGFLNDF